MILQGNHESTMIKYDRVLCCLTTGCGSIGGDSCQFFRKWDDVSEECGNLFKYDKKVAQLPLNFFISQLVNISTADKHKLCALCDKSMKLCTLLFHNVIVTFRRGDIQFDIW